MLRIVLLTSVFAAIASVTPGSVRASEGPWCALRNFGSDLSEDCQFRTFEECRVTVVAGFRGFCNPNPRWPAAVEPRKSRKG
jgi:uncharacterized protein DUF3551